MFVEERHQEILYLLQENEKVKVKELSKQVGVTEDCIRKDLASIFLVLILYVNILEV